MVIFVYFIFSKFISDFYYMSRVRPKLIIFLFYIVPELVDCSKYLHWEEYPDHDVLHDPDMMTVIKCLEAQMHKMHNFYKSKVIEKF